jgi:hypothetical protein
MSQNSWTITIRNVPQRLASDVLIPFASSKRLTRLVIALLEGYQNDDSVRSYVEKALGTSTEPTVEQVTASAPAVSNIEQLEAELADIRAWMTTLVAQGGLVPTTVDADSVEPVEEEPVEEATEEAPVETVRPTLPPVEETVDTDGYNIDIDLEDADAMDSFFAGLDSFE